MLILIVGLILSFWLWRALAQQEHVEIRRSTAKEAAMVRTAIGNRMLVRAQALIRLAQRMQYWGGPRETLWQMNVQLLEEHLPGYQAIQWVDPSMNVYLSAPIPENEQRVGHNLSEHPDQVAAFNEAKETRKPAISRILQSEEGRLIFSIHAPVYQEDRFMGEVMGVFRASDIFDAIINQLETEESALRGYSFSILSAGKELYTHFNGRRDLEADWSISVPFHIQGTVWTLKVWPTEQLFRDMRTPLPEAALAGGAATTVLLALAAYLAMLARWHARRTEIANQHLLEEIDERHRAETALRDMADQLTRSNNELQDFASVASHDLQEPLRKIQSFGDRLNVICAGQLNDKGQDYLQRMNQAAGRMRRLIEDLLTFSRVTTQAKPFRPVDLSEIAAEVVDDLEARIEQSGGQVDVGALPTLDADPLQMRQLLQNLIGNGLKFQKPSEPPKVRVEGKIILRDGSPPMVRLTVQDNGIGFDEKYLDRIFTVFQRLHSRTEYAGTGVGLAICRKIAQRHGGNITGHSAPGQGATFVVTLPARHEETEDAVQVSESVSS